MVDGRVNRTEPNELDWSLAIDRPWLIADQGDRRFQLDRENR